MYNKIYFRYGTMFSGKSLNLISTAETFKFNNKNTLILKPSKDKRDYSNVRSRMSNIQYKAVVVSDSIENLYDFILDIYNKSKFDIILIDEVQFLSPNLIEQLVEVSTICPIICYGLKSSYTGDLFPSIAKLLTIAEDIQEVKTSCRYCDNKATHNLLLRNGQPVYNGDMINVEGSKVNEEYHQVCRYHFYNFNK